MKLQVPNGIGIGLGLAFFSITVLTVDLLVIVTNDQSIGIAKKYNLNKKNYRTPRCDTCWRCAWLGETRSLDYQNKKKWQLSSRNQMPRRVTENPSVYWHLPIWVPTHAILADTLSPIVYGRQLGLSRIDWWKISVRKQYGWIDSLLIEDDRVAQTSSGRFILLCDPSLNYHYQIQY